MEYFSAIKRDEVLTHATTRKHFQKIVLSIKKKPISKDFILYDSIHVAFAK